MNINIEEILNPEPLFTFKVFGYTVPITASIVVMWIIMAAMIILAFIFTRNLKTIPDGKQNVVESIVEFINNLMKNNIGHHWRYFAPYFGTVFLFLIFANTVSIFNVIPGFEISPPTKDLNVTATMGMLSILLVLFCGIGFKGIKGWLKGFIKPSPIMTPFHILDYGTRTLSLSFRLFGNIFAAFIIMELIYSVMPPIIPAALSIYFDLFDGFLQAYIFVFLSSIYISEAIE